MVIWLGATVALRIAGQWVLRPDRPLSIIALFVISGYCCFGFPVCYFAFAIPRDQYALGAIALVAPGMFLDT